MEISSAFVGTAIPETGIELTWRRTTSYAAAVGDNNPRYFDDESSQGLVAPPMLATALTWGVSLRLPNILAEAGFPAEVFSTQVHYSERLDFHRLMKPGDCLTISGQVAEISPHRAGTHFVVRYDVRDKGGELVFTEYSGAMLRGVGCPDGGRKLDLPDEPPLTWDADPAWESELFIDPLAPYLYDGCADIVFPIHTSPAFARMVGLPGIIYQGTAALAVALREIVNREAGADPGRIKSVGCRFTGMIRPGSTIKLISRSAEPSGQTRLLAFQVVNGEGVTALKKGWALVV